MQQSNDKKVEEEALKLMQLGLACLDVFKQTGNRLQFTAFLDQADAFADEYFDGDLQGEIERLRRCQQ